MNGHGRSGAALAVITLAGCAPGALYLHDEPIEGPYRLRALVDAAETHICYERANGACDLRIPERVFAIGFDEDFIVAAVHPLNDESETAFYYIVRDFDGPRADVKRAVRGPFENDAFVEEMREHGVPEPGQVVPRR
jgi:hypothetical protein